MILKQGFIQVLYTAEHQENRSGKDLDVLDFDINGSDFATFMSVGVIYGWGSGKPL